MGWFTLRQTNVIKFCCTNTIYQNINMPITFLKDKVIFMKFETRDGLDIRFFPKSERVGKLKKDF